MMESKGGASHISASGRKQSPAYVVLVSRPQQIEAKFTTALRMLLYCSTLVALLLIVQAPKGGLCARKLTNTDDDNNNNSNSDDHQPNHNHNHQHQHQHHFRNSNNQDTTSDTADASSQDASDQSSYEATGSSEPGDDRLPPPNELSVIRMNDTSVVLRWEFPENSQEHLQFFKIQYKSTKNSKNNSEGWKTVNHEIPPTTRAYQINGLRPGNFLFAVFAVYDNDDNISSEAFKFKIRARSKIRLEEMPEMRAPHIHWTEAQSDYFRFKWKYEPKDNDTEYFGFLVFYRSAHAVSEFTIYNTLDTSVEIAEVEPDTPYEAKVVAYNTVGVSEFSETISIRTKSRQQNASSAATAPPANNLAPTSAVPPTSPADGAPGTGPALATSTTRRPSFPSMQPTLSPAHKGSSSSSNSNNNNNNNNNNTLLGPATPGAHGNSTTITTSANFWQNMVSTVEQLFTDQSDSMTIVRYLLIVLVPLLCIIVLLIFVIKPHKGKKSPSDSDSSEGSMQFDLEINGYFKNSFPGVGKEYPSVCINVNNGFVNNHPHIDDST